MIKAVIDIDDIRVFDVLLPEIESRHRSIESIKKEAKKVVVQIESNDATAFRASMNNLTKMLSVWEKMKGIGK